MKNKIVEVSGISISYKTGKGQDEFLSLIDMAHYKSGVMV
jgi:hypothetical protein